jgi:alkylhydroperoxidase family enzyme
VLRLAVRLSNASPGGVVDKELFDLLQRHYTDEQIVELAIVIAVLVGMAKMLFAMDWADKDTVCPMPVRAQVQEATPCSC